MDPDEAAGTAAETTSLSGCSLWKLQTSCAIILFCQGSSAIAAESSTVWLEIPPTQRHGRLVAVSATGVCHGFVMLTLASVRWIAECVYAGSSHALPNPLPPTGAGAKGGGCSGADGTAPVTHLAENKKKGRGEWVRWSVFCVREHAMWDSQYLDHRRGTGGRAVGIPCRHFDSKAIGFPNFDCRSADIGE